ncbi:SWIM zinc finger family protein [Methanothermococcus okinawensis]|uniref:Zinc finger SWIM domain-containing protein n=1 Tax=Methanothermococcus okinawensis (strain DSM 14208 / JCM 11175 / IH1) TaxID=647113 RepID=F8AMC4_METOI|nr:SWIM zinc finger family protein [Methanothermococcus okinawensis]AEH06814.1 zinc finger SWIM domain-containing protein [Methanothermococcus okinawensis IH1]
MDYENIYNKKIIERGKYYYKNNLVIFCVKFENKLYGKVMGGDEYNTVVDLSDWTGICSCPYRYNCKHAYALIEAYKNNNYINGDELFNNLKNKSKDDIINVLKNIILKYNLWDELIQNKNSLVEKGKSILKLIPIERKNIFTFKSFLRNNFLKNSKDDELLELLNEVGKSEYLDADDVDTIDIVEMIASEIFERKNKDLAEKTLELSKKYKNKLWIVNEYYYDYYDYYGELSKKEDKS